MRLFTAMELPEDARRHLEDLTGAVKRTVGHASAAYGGRRSVSVTRPENLHVTLKFLGEVPEGDVPALCDALRAVRVDGPILVRADGFELLPPRGSIRVVAVGLGGDVGAVRLLARGIEAVCGPLGFPPERRDYRAHVTLARARDPLPPGVRNHLPGDLRARLPGPPFHVGAFVLFESRLGPEGPRYFPLARFPLNRADRSA